MALTARLETIAPGQGLFRIAGIEAPGEMLELAIQRNLDDRYLGTNQAWQTTPHWHSMPGVQFQGGELRVPVGPEIFDEVAAASNMALRVLVRAHGDEASAVLRIKGHLLGSPAAREMVPPEPGQAPSPEPDLGRQRDLETLGELRETPPESPVNGRGSRALRAGLLILAVVVGAGIGAWQLGWLDQWRRPAESETPRDASAHDVAGPGVSEIEATLEPEQEAPAESVRNKPAQTGADIQPPAPPPEPEGLLGVERARAFLADDPHAAAIHAEAVRRERAGDCDAAMVLYNRAAEADTQFASALARRFDPQGFVSRGCIEAHDATTASLWYREAADAGDMAAQRRLGQMLIERETSGPVFEDGIRWLRLAARAGDAEAKELLAKLKKL